MKVGKDKVVEAILFFAKKYGQEDNFKNLISEYSGLPRIVEMITYEMFLKQFLPYHCTSEEHMYYLYIHEYATELKEKGWVEHN